MNIESNAIIKFVDIDKVEIIVDTKDIYDKRTACMEQNLVPELIVIKLSKGITIFGINVKWET